MLSITRSWKQTRWRIIFWFLLFFKVSISTATVYVVSCPPNHNDRWMPECSPIKRCLFSWCWSPCCSINQTRWCLASCCVHSRTSKRNGFTARGACVINNVGPFDSMVYKRTDDFCVKFFFENFAVRCESLAIVVINVFMWNHFAITSFVYEPIRYDLMTHVCIHSNTSAPLMSRIEGTYEFYKFDDFLSVAHLTKFAIFR